MAELFDQHATSYEEDLAKALNSSGENREFFAAGRIAWLKRCLDELGVPAHRILDFGCGDGFAAPMLLDGLGGSSLLGLDVSEKSLELARQRHGSDAVRFELIESFASDASIDVAYCNGVFHHIPTREQPRAVSVVARALRPGGLFALWENNPWNLATHYVMARCEFDADAEMLTPRTARKLLAENGFSIVRTDFRFIFPRSLRWFRPLEDLVYKYPLGTQYQILARKR